jgi:GTP-sensing pleiotropic transcriptional regulator CodY
MIIYQEKTNHGRKQEERTIYSSSNFQDMVQTLDTAVESGSQIRVHYGKLMGVSFMEAQYQGMKISEQEIKFYSAKSVNDRCSFYLSDITDIEIGEDSDTGYVTFKITMKDKTFASISPL